MEGKLNEEARKQFLIEFGKNLRKIRKRKKMSQTDLAMKINGDVQKIGRIERGEYDFKISSILILANVLEISVEELIGFKNINNLKNLIWEQIEN